MLQRKVNKNGEVQGTRLYQNGKIDQRLFFWLVKFHPELTDGQVSKLVGTTKPTISAIRDRSHWNIQNIQPIDPVALGLCTQSELDLAVQKANAKKALKGSVLSDEDRRKLVSTSESLNSYNDDTKASSAISEVESFTLLRKDDRNNKKEDEIDAESLFKKPLVNN